MSKITTKRWLIVFNIGNFLDWLTTCIALSQSGTIHEANPFMAPIFAAGFGYAFLFKAAVGAFITYHYSKYDRRRSAMFLALLYILVPIWNIVMIHIALAHSLQ